MVPKGIVRTINIPANAAAQTIVLPGVFTDSDGQDAFNEVQVMKIPDSGPIWLGLWTDTAVIDGPDVSLVPDGAIWSSFKIGNVGWRMRQRPHRPDLHLSVIYAAGGWVEFSLF
jgi:hypothetical protein